MPKSMICPDNNWKEFFRIESGKDYFIELKNSVENEYASKTVYPPIDRIFSAYSACGPDGVKAVIFGQDPYHNVGQANGLAFATDTKDFPPSLQNIFKELAIEYKREFLPSGTLSGWVKQGVMLLNNSLTVVAHSPMSHAKLGWDKLLENTIDYLNKSCSDIVFILLGRFVANQAQKIDKSRHAILTAPHPSPLSAHAGFFGSNIFRKANACLTSRGKETIDWLKTE